jgi:hypothetical protein
MKMNLNILEWKYWKVLIIMKLYLFFIYWGDEMKYLRVGMLFIVVCLIFAPVSTAWTWNSHSKIVDSTYYSLPTYVQSKLSLTAMRDGSNDPDEIFHDNRVHSYPYSYNKAVYYLNQGSTYYKLKKYALASKSFGIASHYISDSFSAPHCVSGETSSQHSSYENQASKLTPHVTFKSGGLNTLMQSGYNSGKIDWSNWIKTRYSYYPQKDLNLAASVTAKAIKNSLGATTTIVTSVKYVGNSNSKKFHISTCSYVSQMSADHRVNFSTRQAAIKAGYIPCKVCNP